jgi:hypothetical protein
MELLVKPEILTSYIYGLTFGNAESRLFIFAAQCSNIIILRWMLRKLEGVVRTGWSWLRIGTGGGHL